MGRFFFYLPLYYAVNKRLPELLATTPYTDVPIHPVTTEAGITKDEDVVRTILKDKDFMFGACDPVEVLRLNKRQQAEYAIIGALVTNAAFWAANHETHNVDRFQDLARYSRVVGYDKGSSSYRVMSRIQQCSDKENRPEIVSVARGDEIRHLDTRVGAPDSVVITPDLPGVLQAKRRLTGVEIELALGTQGEFQHVLMTALVTRRETVENHRGLVIALLASLEVALREANSGSEEIRQFARTEFHMDYGRTYPDLIDEAINRGRNSEVFPATVKIYDRDWKAAVANFASAEGLENSNSLADESYDRLVKVYTPLATEALEFLESRGGNEKLVPVAPHLHSAPPANEVASPTLPKAAQLAIAGAAVLTAIALLGPNGLPEALGRVLLGIATFLGALALPAVLESILSTELPVAKRRKCQALWAVFGIMCIAYTAMPRLQNDLIIALLVVVVVPAVSIPVSHKFGRDD